MSHPPALSLDYLPCLGAFIRDKGRRVRTWANTSCHRSDYCRICILACPKVTNTAGYGLSLVALKLRWLAILTSKPHRLYPVIQAQTTPSRPHFFYSPGEKMATIASTRPASTAFPAQQDAALSSHQYTCNTCQVAFRYADTQKGHMKSDWQ